MFSREIKDLFRAVLKIADSASNLFINCRDGYSVVKTLFTGVAEFFIKRRT